MSAKKYRAKGFCFIIPEHISSESIELLLKSDPHCDDRYLIFNGVNFPDTRLIITTTEHCARTVQDFLEVKDIL